MRDLLMSLNNRVVRRRCLALLVFAPLLLVAAKCIDNETLYQDSSGDWHVVGEIHNNTDVWGADMELSGQLLDASGNVIASTQTPVCPLELAPNSFDGFDLHFRQSAALRPTGYSIHVIKGRALDRALPSSGISLNGFAARKTASSININGSVASTRTYTRVLTGCIAFYNSAGRVVTHITAINFGLTLPLAAGTPQPVSLPIPITMIQPDATGVRLWLTGDAAAPLASDYAATMTTMIPVQ